jgi:predicted GNAT family N-acyltransferase
MTERTEHSWSVDGIEEGVVRIEEDGERILHLPRHLLPVRVTEGQLLRVTRSSASGPESIVVTISIDRVATTESLRKSKATMAQAMAESTKRDPGGDVAL